MDQTFKPTHLPTKYQDDPLVAQKRADFMHRSTWMYLLIDEMRKHGLDIETARAAVRRCGVLDAHNRYSEDAGVEDYDDLVAFCNAIFSDVVQKTLEADVRVDENDLDVEFHYCPHITAWQKLTDDPELINRLCDIAMEGDRAIAAAHPNWEYTLTDRIGAGCKSCRMHFHRIK